MNIETVINEKYIYVLGKISNSLLFGFPIEKNDIKQLVVAAYYAGREKEEKIMDHEKEIDW